ncbi:hypothetical protein CDL15_Pgr028460 [Punica granatum]|uniref:NAC domain-containing protein n=1 Tax=Punica granatum TaxID=22663 RepID=A0A218VWN7_PUNGR|nr:hypothetical protein CDL15_Pgr028460 [Punica granatum]
MEEEIVGFKFHPTGYELVNHHLRRKLQKVNESRCVIPDVNIYDYNPQDLRNVYNARGGYWKETSKKQDIEEEKTGKTIGTKRSLVFYCGKQGNANMTEWAMYEYHLNADAANSTITDPTAMALCHIKKKAQNKKRNWKKQQSKKGNSKKQQSKRGNLKKQQCKKAGSPSLEANLSSPEGIETQETNFQELSLAIEEENIPTQPEKGSPSVGVCSAEPVLMAERSAVVYHGSDNEHGYTCNVTYEQSDSNMQSGPENLGSKETCWNSSFLGQPSVESRTPMTKSPVFGWPDPTAGGTCHNEGNTAYNSEYEDGICLSELDFWRDEQLIQEQIHDALY